MDTAFGLGFNVDLDFLRTLDRSRRGAGLEEAVAHAVVPRVLSPAQAVQGDLPGDGAGDPQHQNPAPAAGAAGRAVRGGGRPEARGAQPASLHPHRRECRDEGRQRQREFRGRRHQGHLAVGVLLGGDAPDRLRVLPHAAGQGDLRAGAAHQQLAHGRRGQPRARRGPVARRAPAHGDGAAQPQRGRGGRHRLHRLLLHSRGGLRRSLSGHHRGASACAGAVSRQLPVHAAGQLPSHHPVAAAADPGAHRVQGAAGALRVLQVQGRSADAALLAHV
eukprot:scaffold69_cov248-Pinguiococcus_pyrenoidosus.AAC.36